MLLKLKFKLQSLCLYPPDICVGDMVYFMIHLSLLHYWPRHLLFTVSTVSTVPTVWSGLQYLVAICKVTFKTELFLFPMDCSGTRHNSLLFWRLIIYEHDFVSTFSLLFSIVVCGGVITPTVGLVGHIISPGYQESVLPGGNLNLSGKWCTNEFKIF